MNGVPRPDVPAPRLPRLLVVALVVVLAEAAALTAAGIAFALDVVLGRAEYVASTLGIGVFAWGFAALLAGAARGLSRGRRWGRAPIATWQILQGAVGFLQLPGMPWFGALLIVSGLVVLVGLFAPASIAATAGVGGDPEADVPA